ncbi:MAG TPA: hypothetical protein VKA84_26220 [Gemmatimonadaceae bacterium]|nr:hypothetical protein [Gemmatimonadaceae bacterium]
MNRGPAPANELPVAAAVAVLAAALVAPLGSLRGQLREPAGALRSAPVADSGDGHDARRPARGRRHIALPRPRGSQDASATTAPWWAPLASAVVPGAGQAVLEQDRFVAYVAVETYAWSQYAVDLREGRRQQRAYEQLAANVARATFGGSRPVGDFEYYERMEHFVESGLFDLAPDGPLDPETDSTTFNGATWLLARQTFWPDPRVAPDPGSAAYRSAIEFYERRAIRPEFRWSWRNAQLEQDLYRRTITRSNDAYRRSVQNLGLVIANHVLSTVDSYVTVRLRRRTGGGGFGFVATMPWPTRLDPAPPR